MKTILTSALAMCLAVHSIAQIPTNNLAAYYPFSGNSNDATGNGHNGTNFGAILTQDRFGNANSAYHFNGTNAYIEIPNNPTINFTDSLSISLWFEMDVATPGSTRLLDKGIGNTNSGYLITAHTTGYSFIGGSIGTLPGQGASHKTLQLNQWYHVVMIFKNNNVALYLNGQFDTSFVGTSPIQANTNNLRIAASNPLSTFFQGTIDDIRIYNSALSYGNVLALYNESLCFQNITVTDTLYINANFTGFNPISYSNTIKMYPNPASTDLIIDYGTNFSYFAGYTLKIENSLSQIVYQTGITQQNQTVNLSSWTGNGLYFVLLINSTGNTLEIRKIVLQ